MTKTGLASSVVASVLLVSGAASAQQYVAQADTPQWLKDRSYGQGAGVQTGDFELHPSFSGEVGYDSNWFSRSSSSNGYANSSPGAPVVPAAEFRITPALTLATLTPQRGDQMVAQAPSVAFRAGVSATYREFIGLSNTTSSPSNDISQQRNIGVAADARLDVLPEHPLGGAVYASYGRVIQPNVTTADPDQSFTYDIITAGAELSVRPGSGTLSWAFGYRFQDSIFETSTGSPYNNYAHRAYTRGQWRFRPRTALIYDATIDYMNYTNAAEAVPVLLVQSTPVRVRFGINGLITDRFAAEATAGWGASFFSVAFPQEPQYDSVIAHAELKWYLSASPGIAKASMMSLSLSSIAVGYDRNFQSTYLGSYFGTDRGFLKFTYFFAGRALVTLEGGGSAIEYPQLFWADFTPRHPAFNDVRVDATLFSEYRFTESIGLNLTLRYTANISNTQLQLAETAPLGVSVTAPANLYDMNWNRFEAYVGLRWFL